MERRPIFRLALWLLPLLLLCNILFYAWFARNTRETAADEVVQKAYIVSRMLSEFSARSLDRGDLTGLKRIMEEAFRDRHIVAVGVIDPRGKVILQSTVPRVYQRLSTFETPVKLGERTVANLVTSFSLDESDELIALRLRHTAVLQLCLLLLVAATLAWFCRREWLATATPAGQPGEGTEALSPSPAAEEALTGHDAPLAVEEMVAERKVESAVGVVPGPGERALLFLGEAERQLQVVTRAEECLSRIASWHRQAMQGSASAASLLASGREIVALLQGDNPGGTREMGEDAPAVTAAIAGELAEIATALRRLADGVAGDGSGERGSLLSPDDSARLAGELAREGIGTIRERVFPALATAVAAGEDVAARLAPLLEKVAECGDRSAGLTRCSGELLDLADGIRLLRREMPPAVDGEAGGEERLSSLAERLESLADGLKRDSRDLLGVANEATAASRTILSALDHARDRLLAAGSTVEDAAAAALMGSDHLQSFLRRGGVEVDEPFPRDREGGTLSELGGLSGRLAATAQLLAAGQESPPRLTEAHAQSLAMACDNLLLASRFLEEIATGAAALLTAGGNGEGEGGENPTPSTGIGRLIAADPGHSHRSTPAAEEGCGTE
jgi:hypothetical protein